MDFGFVLSHFWGVRCLADAFRVRVSLRPRFIVMLISLNSIFSIEAVFR